MNYPGLKVIYQIKDVGLTDRSVFRKISLHCKIYGNNQKVEQK
jgi:hypothetical protein